MLKIEEELVLNSLAYDSELKRSVVVLPKIEFGLGGYTLDDVIMTLSLLWSTLMISLVVEIKGERKEFQLFKSVKLKIC